MTQPTSTSTMVLRAAVLRCPHCGARGLFVRYVTLRERCPGCGLHLQRGESDHFIGAYLLNLVVVEIVFAIALATIMVATYPDTPWTLLQWGGAVTMLAAAVLCYPFSRALWLAADLVFRPVAEADFLKRDRPAASMQPPR